MVCKQRLRLSGFQLVQHYAVVPLLLILPALYCFFAIQRYFLNMPAGSGNLVGLLKLAIPSALLAILFYFIQKRRLRFKEFLVHTSTSAFHKALERTAADLGWRIANNTKHTIQAHRPWNWSSSWGEMITIRRFKDKILINSICDPYAWPSVISYGWNRRNVDTFIAYLKQEVERQGRVTRVN
jgi:hypothetical protein